VLRYCICLTACFLYTNEFKDFTLENRSSKSAGWRTANTLANSIIQGQGYITLYLLLLLWLEEFDLVERVEARVDINEPASRVATRHGCPVTGLPDEMSG
jgi:hypothetical protein